MFTKSVGDWNIVNSSLCRLFLTPSSPCCVIKRVCCAFFIQLQDLVKTTITSHTFHQQLNGKFTKFILNLFVRRLTLEFTQFFSVLNFSIICQRNRFYFVFKSPILIQPLWYMIHNFNLKLSRHFHSRRIMFQLPIMAWCKSYPRELFLEKERQFNFKFIWQRHHLCCFSKWIIDLS